MAAVRQDVVQIGFDIDMGDLNKLTDEMDNLKKTCNAGFGDDALDELIKDTKKASGGLQDTDKSAGKAHEQLRKIASTGFEKTISGVKRLGSAVGKLAVNAGKVLAKGLVAGVAGVGTLVTKAVLNFADYEQLVGGVDTLFKNSTGFVQKNAQNAFKTAGLSANEYMSTVTSFSASLIQSLGGDTKAAAKYAHTAIVDMSDNANKMGTDMSSIQDAYQGFAKQNYTMLDNLKLGYGGTKEEMSRLLKDASAIAGVDFDISSYADVVQAIHVIQEEMGIAGTTAKEASETISGSWSSLKSAWSNTLTSLIVGGDQFDRSIDNLIESAKTFGKNIMPAIQKALSGVGELITELAPVIEKELPGIIDKLLPPLIQAATSLVKGVIVALPDIVSTLAKELPNVLSQLWDGIKEAFGDIPGMDKADAFFGKLSTWLTENAGMVKKVIGGVIGLVAAFKLFSKIKGFAGLFGGGAGGAGGGFFSGLASMKPMTALKGMANLAIIIGGLGILAAAVMAAAPYMAQLSDLQSVAEVLTVISAVGLIGTGMAKLSGMVGNIPVATVAKGLANIAIVMAGFAVLAAALMWVAPYMAQLSDLNTTMQLLLVIGAVGLVGAALAGLSGAVGMIPTGVVLSGLANIALVLGGFTAVAAAFGALSKVEGFNELISSGGEVLSNLCGILGEMAGSLIGGLGEGITNSLPTIGENLSAFATSLQPMFDTFAGVDASGLSDFAGSLAAFIAVIAGEKIVSVITGGINYADLGAKLSTMATSLSGFFSTIMTFPDGGFEKASALFECLAGISSMPKDGGLVGWFQGEVNFASIASGIQQLASAGMLAALNTLAGIPETAFTGLSAMFDALAGIKEMPKGGGIAGWFAGDAATGLANISSQLPGVASNIASFFSNLGGITDFSPIKSLFDTLGGIEISSDAAEGTGLFGLGASALETMGSGLSSFADKAATFFTTINGLNLSNLKGFFNELSTMGQLPTTLSTLDVTIGVALSNMVTTVQTKMNEIKSKVSSGLTSVVTMIDSTSSALYTSGVNAMSGLNNGMLVMVPTLLATAAMIAGMIASTIDSALDIHSPSRRTMLSGEYAVKGVDVGMQKMIPSVEATAVDVADAAVPYTGSYSPYDSSGTVYNNSGGNSEYNTVSPVFNLTINGGTQDDRSTARKVKQWVAEAFSEIIDSMDRKLSTAGEA